MIKRIFLLLIIIIILFVPILPSATADGCIFHHYEFEIYEPGQNAIISWNGEQEVMILSVDVYSKSDTTKAVHVVPFPSKPSYSLADPYIFENVQWKMQEKSGYKSNIPSLWDMQDYYYDRVPASAGLNEGGIDIISHEQVGPHDITVARVAKFNEFRDWANSYFKANNLKDIKLPENTNDVVDFYLEKGYKYFVFDIIEIGETHKSVEPLAYTFKTDVLYYPLKISSLLEGSGSIDLALITPSEKTVNYSPMRDMDFYCKTSNLWEYNNFQNFNETLAEMFTGDVLLDHYRLSNIELEKLDDDIELPIVENIWQFTNQDYIFKPLKSDFNGDGSSEFMYFDRQGINLFDPKTGKKIWSNSTGGYINYNDIEYFDVNKDGFEDMLVYSNNNILLVEPSTRELLCRYDLERMQFYEIIENSTLYLFDEFSIKKIQMLEDELKWDTCLDLANSSSNFYQFVYKTFNISYYGYYGYYDYNDGYDYYEYQKIIEYSYDLFYKPFKSNTLRFCDLNNDGNEEILFIFQNYTCLLDADSGELIWKTNIFNQSDYSYYNNYDISIELDLDNDLYPDIRVNVFSKELYLSGRNGTELNLTDNQTRSTELIYFEPNTRSKNDFNNVQYKCDLNMDNKEDILSINNMALDEKLTLTYSIYFSSNMQWTDEKTIVLDVKSYPREITGADATIFLLFNEQLFGVDIIINEVIWKLDIGKQILVYDIVNIDEDSIKEITFVTENRIIGLDFPSIPIPAQGNVTTTIGPIKYNDNETPVENATINLENDYGLVFTTNTEDSGQSTFDIIPGGYRCVVIKDGETYISYFYVNITDEGMAIYDTPDGQIPVSSKPVPKIDEDKPFFAPIYFGSIVFIIIIFIMIYIGILRWKEKSK